MQMVYFILHLNFFCKKYMYLVLLISFHSMYIYIYTYIYIYIYTHTYTYIYIAVETHKSSTELWPTYYYANQRRK